MWYWANCLLDVNWYQFISIHSNPSVIIAQREWENECISLCVLSIGQVQFPAMAGVFQGVFPWLIPLSS